MNELHLVRRRGAGGGTLKGRFDDAALFDAIATVIDAKSKPLTADDDRPTAQRQAEALGDVCGYVLDHDDVPECGGRRPHLNVLIRLEDLEQRCRSAMLDFGGTVTPESLRMLACDAAVIPIVMDGAGQPLDVGRITRTIPDGLRRAVAARDRGCCYPGATARLPGMVSIINMWGMADPASRTRAVRARRAIPPTLPAPRDAPRRPPVMDIYARLSFAANGETIQVDDQVELCTEKILDRGGVVGEVFKDNSVSAWKPNLVRPDWEALMTRLEGKISDGVMVYDLTRFSRKIMVAAAGESDKISERVRRGKVRRARKGRQHGGPRQYGLPGMLPAPPGWETGDPRTPAPAERVTAERAVIRECHDRLFAGASVSGLVRELNERGAAGERAALPTSGKPWYRSAFVRSMTRPALAALLRHRGTVVGEFAGVEPIVSREEWERMCALFAARKLGRPPEPQHVLSGLITCTVCGTGLTGMPRAFLPPYPDGSGKREHRCRRAKDSRDPGCGRNHIDGRRADQAVAAAIEARLGDPRRAEHVAAHLTRVREQRTIIEAQISQWNQHADDLVTKTATWGVARVDKAMVPILRTIDDLHAELAALDEPDTTTTGATDAVAAWQEALGGETSPRDAP